MANSPIISGHRVGTSVSVTDKYDNLISIQIIKTDPALVLPDYASVSVVVSVVQVVNHIQVATVLGAEHILFNASIRLARMLAVSKLASGVADGFYFRDNRGFLFSASVLSQVLSLKFV
jgi:hypothetical protein